MVPTTVVNRELKRKKNQTMLSMEAFEAYYALGDARTFEALSEALCVPLATLKGWAKRDQWNELVQARNYEIMKAVAEKRKHRLVMSKEKQLDMLVSMVEDKMVAKDDGTIGSTVPIADVQDLERVIKLINLQTGEATERPENSAPAIQFIIKNAE